MQKGLTNEMLVLGPWRHDFLLDLIGLIEGLRPDNGMGRPDFKLRSWKLLILDLRGPDLRGLN